MISQEECAAKEGKICPVCKSKNIQYDHAIDWGDTGNFYKCLNCNARWEDIYELVGYDCYEKCK